MIWGSVFSGWLLGTGEMDWTFYMFVLAVLTRGLQWQRVASSEGSTVDFAGTLWPLTRSHTWRISWTTAGGPLRRTCVRDVGRSRRTSDPEANPSLTCIHGGRDSPSVVQPTSVGAPGIRSFQDSRREGNPSLDFPGWLENALNADVNQTYFDWYIYKFGEMLIWNPRLCICLNYLKANMIG